MDDPDLAKLAQILGNAMGNLAEVLKADGIASNPEIVANSCRYITRIGRDFEKLNTKLREKVHTFDHLEAELRAEKAAKEGLAADLHLQKTTHETMTAESLGVQVESQKKMIESLQTALQASKASNQTLSKRVDDLESLASVSKEALASKEEERSQLASMNHKLLRVQKKYHETVDNLLQDLTAVALSQAPGADLDLIKEIEHIVFGAERVFEHLGGRIEVVGTNMGLSSQNVTRSTHNDTVTSQSNSFQSQSGAPGSETEAVDPMEPSTTCEGRLNTNVDGSTSRAQTAVTDTILAAEMVNRQTMTVAIETMATLLRTEFRRADARVNKRVDGVVARVDQQEIEIDGAHEDLDNAYEKLKRHRADINEVRQHVRDSKRQKLDE